MTSYCLLTLPKPVKNLMNFFCWFTSAEKYWKNSANKLVRLFWQYNFHFIHCLHFSPKFNDCDGFTVAPFTLDILLAFFSSSVELLNQTLKLATRISPKRFIFFLCLSNRTESINLLAKIWIAKTQLSVCYVSRLFWLFIAICVSQCFLYWSCRIWQWVQLSNTTHECEHDFLD